MRVKIVDDFGYSTVAYAIFEDEAAMEEAQESVARYREFCAEFDDVVTYQIRDALKIIERYAMKVDVIEDGIKTICV